MLIPLIQAISSIFVIRSIFGGCILLILRMLSIFVRSIVLILLILENTQYFQEVDTAYTKHYAVDL